MDEFAFMDATAQAELVRTKQVQSLELVEAAVQRIQKLNPKINAVVTPLFEQARETAKGKLPEGPFTGVPFLLKDLVATLKGVPLSCGAKLSKDFIPDHDSELVKRFKAAGLIILGKTNTPEFGIHATTEPDLWGPTRNPWDLTRTAGGSSGGSAAAVAAGMVPMAHGNDGGGSIRIPASCCGLFGLKPTRARTSLGPDIGDILSGLVVENALTRTVRDGARLLDAIRGPGIGDPYVAPAPERPFLEEIKIPPGKLKVVFSTQTITGYPVDPECQEALNSTIQLLKDLGHVIEEQDLNFDADAVKGAFTCIWTSGAAHTLNLWGKMMGKTVKAEDVEIFTWALAEAGRAYSAADYLGSLQVVQKFSRQVGEQFQNWDLLLTPSLAKPPVPLGWMNSTADNPLGGFFKGGEFTPFTALANVTGQPAVSLPLFWSEEGLPIGTQFVARYGDEATLFRLSAQLEAARPWASRIPDIVSDPTP